MPEKNLLASFSDLQAAKHCQDSLREQGFDVVQVDVLDAPGDNDPLSQTSLVEWGRYGYQSRRLDDKWTSSASWTNSQTGMIEGAQWILTAVVPADDAPRVAEVIQQYGGSL